MLWRERSCHWKSYVSEFRRCIYCMQGLYFPLFVWFRPATSTVTRLLPCFSSFPLSVQLAFLSPAMPSTFLISLLTTLVCTCDIHRWIYELLVKLESSNLLCRLIIASRPRMPDTVRRPIYYVQFAMHSACRCIWGYFIIHEMLLAIVNLCTKFWSF